ncbi:MAG: hypothetical protein HOP96_10440 [Sphingomonas sp.]|nr:hypothetical protein [Sphingomonas sp.]
MAWNKRSGDFGLSATAAGCLWLTACVTTPATGSADETIFEPPSRYFVQAEARGRALRLKVDPGAPFFVLLNDKVAKDLRLVGTKAATLAVGPMRLKGTTRSEKLTISGVTASKPVMWVKGQAVSDADGVINPANLPSGRVTLRLRPPQPNEQAISLPMRFDRERGLYYEFNYGGQIILTRFTLNDKLTTTTGAAASVIAKRRQGIWDGGPFVHPVRFGISRPMRRMVLGETLSVSGFPLNEFAVRILDDRGSYLLPEKETPSEVDEDGIIITGKNRRSYGAPHFWMMIGSDDLSRCSSISYDNRAKNLILNCAITKLEERRT